MVCGSRATRNIDFGIAVESWEQFARLKEGLVATGDFESDPRALQRLLDSDHAAGFSIPIDLIPFRGVASANGTIEWPPSRDIVMNLAGFEEALASSVPMEMDKDLNVRVASVPGLTLLKLVAWSDRGRETNKDAADLYRLLIAYADAGNTDRLYDLEMELLATGECRRNSSKKFRRKVTCAGAYCIDTSAPFAEGRIVQRVDVVHSG
jgi:predicted nucleotidyltransferase